MDQSWGIFKGVLLGFGLFFKIFWPYIPLFVALILGKWALSYLKDRRLSSSAISDIDQMDGRTFERYLRVVFAASGYKVELTKYVGDFGGDLVLARDGVKTVVQAKRSKKKVDVRAVQEALGAVGYYGCSRAMVVTNSTFTEAAMTLARANNVELWGRDRLIREFLAAPPSAVTDARDQQAVAVVPATGMPIHPAATELPTPNRPGGGPAICVVCGQLVSEKVAQYCRDHSQRFTGQIYCFKHQRGRWA